MNPPKRKSVPEDFPTLCSNFSGTRRAGGKGSSRREEVGKLSSPSYVKNLGPGHSLTHFLFEMPSTKCNSQRVVMSKFWSWLQPQWVLTCSQIRFRLFSHPSQIPKSIPLYFPNDPIRKAMACQHLSPNIHPLKPEFTFLSFHFHLPPQRRQAAMVMKMTKPLWEAWLSPRQRN